MKGIVSAVLSLALAFGAVTSAPFAVNALEYTDQPSISTYESHGQITDSGKCGDKATYTIYEDGTMIVSGSGEMSRYAQFFKTDTKLTVQDVIIEDGITAVGGLFYLINPETVTMPESVKIIYDDTFSGCTRLLGVNIPKGIEYINKSAFSNTPWLSFMKAQGNFVIFNGILIDIPVMEGKAVVPQGVREIAYRAFEHTEDITEVVLPDTVTTIREYAFALSSVKHINLPDGITEIGRDAFQRSALETVKLPAGLKIISENTFSSCFSLKEVELQEGLEIIKSYAFWGCEKLEYISLPESVHSVNSYAFRECEKLKSIDFSDKLYNISSNAFDDTELLYNKLNKSPLVVVNDVALLGNYCYGDVDIPYGTRAVGYRTFSENKYIETVHIPESMRQIASSSFYCCTNLKYVNIENGLELISDDAFNGCRNLEAVTIPESVEYIGKNAFVNPVIYGVAGSYAEQYAKENNLSFVAVEDTEHLDVLSSGKLNDTIDYTQYIDGRLVLCGEGSVSRVDIADGIDINKVKSIVVCEGITDIGSYAFQSMPELEKISLCKGIGTIGNSSFRSCPKLKAVTLPEGVESIGNKAFADCTMLGAMYIPQSVKSISTSGINTRTNTVIWGFENSYAEQYAVEHNISFVPMNEQANGNIIDFKVYSYALFDDGTLILNGSTGSNVYISDNYYSPAKAPWNPLAVKRIKALSETFSIGDNSFSGNIYLESVDLSKADKLTEIGKLAFGGCVNLREILPPPKLLSIGDSVFVDCASLRKIAVPDSVTYIDKYAFYKAGNITIVCSYGSYAEQYAKEKHIAYELTDAPATDVIGDVNFDGKLSIHDVTLIQRLLAELFDADQYQLEVSDVDKNGVISISDATYVQRLLAELE